MLHSREVEEKHYVSMAYLKVKKKKKYHRQVIVSCTLPLIPLKYIIIRQFLS